MGSRREFRFHEGCLEHKWVGKVLMINPDTRVDTGTYAGDSKINIFAGDIYLLIYI